MKIRQAAFSLSVLTTVALCVNPIQAHASEGPHSKKSPVYGTSISFNDGSSLDFNANSTLLGINYGKLGKRSEAASYTSGGSMRPMTGVPSGYTRPPGSRDSWDQWHAAGWRAELYEYQNGERVIIGRVSEYLTQRGCAQQSSLDFDFSCSSF